MRMLVLTASLLASCRADPVPPPVPAPSAPRPTTGSIEGTVRIEVPAPKERTDFGGVRVQCGNKPIDFEKLKTYVFGDGGTLANAFVTLKSGPVVRRYSPPPQAFVLHQTECRYEPRVFGVIVDQPITVRNDDDVNHNVHFSARANREFNFGHAARGAESTVSFPLPESPIAIKCDVHPWMRAWVHVSEHPFFAVTGLDGRFVIKDLVPGDYEILAWHEGNVIKPLTARVGVSAGATSTQDFTFKAAYR